MGLSPPVLACWECPAGTLPTQNSESVTSSNNPRWQTERLPDQASVAGVAGVLLPCPNTALPYGSSVHAVRKVCLEGRFSESSVHRAPGALGSPVSASPLLRGQQPTEGPGGPQERTLLVVHAALQEGVLPLIPWEHCSDFQGLPTRAKNRG